MHSRSSPDRGGAPAPRRSLLPRGTSLALLAASLLAASGLSLTPARAGGVFVRGDANGDERVSISDASYVLKYLFMGGSPPGCLDAADVEDDGRVNITDSIRLLKYLFMRGSLPCSPFPEPGTDGNGTEASCAEAGGGEPVEDPAARIDILDATATADGTVALTLLVSNASEIAGYSARISVEDDILANGQSSHPVDLTGLLDGGFVEATVAERDLTVGFLTSFTRDVALPPGDGVAVLELPAVCLARGTPAGEYALVVEEGELVDGATAGAILPALGSATLTVPVAIGDPAGCAHVMDGVREAYCATPTDPPDPPDPPDGPQADFLRGDANVDGRLSISDVLHIRRWLFNGDRAPVCLDAADVDDSGQLNITDFIALLNHLFLGAPTPEPPVGVPGPDPTADRLPCAEYDVVEPAESDDVIAIGEAAGPPGGEVSIPVHLTNSVEVEAFQLVVRYDPSSLMLDFPGIDALDLEGTFYEERELGAYFFSVTPFPEEGVALVAFVPSLIETGFEVPPGERRLVFRFRGRISDDAPVDTVVTLEPTNGPDGAGWGPNRLRNELTYGGAARFVSVVPRVEGGVMRIIPDITIFRGDSNQDEVVDIADATFTLNWLFLAGPPPLCFDAADANDDGRVDVSDPIAILLTLFQGASRIAPPYPGRGVDVTADRLGVCP